MAWSGPTRNAAIASDRSSGGAGAAQVVVKSRFECARELAFREWVGRRSFNGNFFVCGWCVARMAGGSASHGKLYFVFVKIMIEILFFPSLLEHLVAVQNKKKSNCPWNEKNQQIQRSRNRTR